MASSNRRHRCSGPALGGQAVYEVSLRKSEELGCSTITSEVIHAAPALRDLSRLYLGCGPAECRMDARAKS
jgi:hypothetical protein